MKSPDHIIIGAVIITFAALRCMVSLIVPLVALLLTLAGWRPSSPPAPASVPALPLALPPAPELLKTTAPKACPPLGCMTVRQLRQVARREGYTQLARSGRKQQLLEALNG